MRSNRGSNSSGNNRKSHGKFHNGERRRREKGEARKIFSGDCEK